MTKTEWELCYDLVGRATQIASYFDDVVLKARALLDVLTRRGVLQNNPCHWEALLTLNWHLLMTKNFVMAQWHTLHITSLTLTAVLPHSLMNSVMEYLFVSKLLQIKAAHDPLLSGIIHLHWFWFDSCILYRVVELKEHFFTLYYYLPFDRLTFEGSTFHFFENFLPLLFNFC